MYFDLISLSQAENWGGTAVSSSEIVTQQLITQVSRQILTWIRRPNILPQSYTDIIDGNGSQRLTLRNWPVTTVSSIIVNHQQIVATNNPPTEIGITANPPGQGFYLKPWDGLPPGGPQQVDIYYHAVPRGRANVAVSYTAGYQVTAEPAVVPGSPYTLSPQQPFGAWASDVSVTYANGTPLVAVSNAPTNAGQYQAGGGSYLFNAADAGESILITYGYVPADLANAAAQWVSELVAYQGRIGIRSKALGGQETVSFNIPGYTGNMANAIPPFVQQILWPYRRVILI